ncbi:MAG: hypothetical protein MJ188_01585 [Treponema sp.]|nr:hypothetical protein [Treponema sp.]
MKKKILFCLLVILVCLGVASCANNSKLTASTKGSVTLNTKNVTLGLGDSITCDSVTIKVLDAVLLEDSIIGVFVTISNNSSDKLDYSKDYDWGSVVTGSGKNLESVLYSDPFIWQNYFSGTFVYPVATAVDFITFQQFEPISTEGYTFMAQPPIEGFPPFKVFFLYDDLKQA